MPPFITCFICLIFSFLNLVRWNSALKNFQNNIEGIENFLNASFHKIKFNTIKKRKQGAEGNSSIHQLTNMSDEMK